MPTENLTFIEPHLLYAVAAVLSFSTASFFYRHFTAQVGALWTNAFKASVAWAIFLGISIAGLVDGDRTQLAGLEFKTVSILLASGLLGLNISDWLMLRAYHAIGPARTIIVYRFQPLLLAAASYFFWNRALTTPQWLAIGLLLACVLVLARERRAHAGRWDLTGIFLALGAMALDGTGILLSREAFERLPDLSPNMANLVRATGALLGFFFISRFLIPIRLLEGFRGLRPRARGYAVFSAILGAWLGLTFWLTALKHAEHPAMVSAVGGLSPLFAIFI
ncbi:MAG: DMT family transporter, partial [Bdellovibrionota bacterium]